MAETEKNMPQREKTPLYTLCRGIANVLFHSIFFLRFHQTENINQLKAPYIIMANHQSWLDPVILALPCKEYEIRFVGKKELTKYKPMAWLVNKLHMITVDRHNTDLQAMRQCSKVLREGKVLGIFPEGTRHQPDLMSEVETGTAVLALRANVPLLPVYVSQKLRAFRRTEVYIGKPMDISDLSAQGFDAQVVNQLTERIRQTFLTMRSEHQKKN